MTRAQAETAVWHAFPHRRPTHWTLTMEEHHTSMPGNRVWRWFLDGMSVRQDHLERCGFVDGNGVEVDP